MMEALQAYSLSTAGIAKLSSDIRDMAEARNAVILAHNYQVPEVQDVAHHVGDSLELSQLAATTDADVIVFCGVHFMAETAAILSPRKRVLIPDLGAGCSLSDTIDAAQLLAWKAEHPGAVVVSYVNCSAEVKAESDYCCTSGNAEAVIRAVPSDREILFLPDMFLGAHLERVTGRKLHVWMGECHVHAGIEDEDLVATSALHPDAELLVHPECGCTSSAIYRWGDRGETVDSPGSGPEAGGKPILKVLSTSGIIRRARESNAEEFIIATETGIMHRLRKEVPDKRFIAASEHAVCRYMKMITLENLHGSLLNDLYPGTVEPGIADRARLALERMVAIV